MSQAWAMVLENLNQMEEAGAVFERARSRIDDEDALVRARSLHWFLSAPPPSFLSRCTNKHRC